MPKLKRTVQYTDEATETHTLIAGADAPKELIERWEAEGTSDYFLEKSGKKAKSQDEPDQDSEDEEPEGSDEQHGDDAEGDTPKPKRKRSSQSPGVES